MKIQVCCGKACKSNFSEYITKRLESDKKFYKLKNLFVEQCPCTGNCKQGPNIIVDGEVVNRVNPAVASLYATGKRKPGAKPKTNRRSRDNARVDNKKTDNKNTDNKKRK